MKIRTDFVTNSSSSSFCVTITVNGESECASLRIDPTDTYCGGGGKADFEISNLNKALNAKSIAELARMLTDSVSLLDYSNEDGDDDQGNIRGLNSRNQDEYLQSVVKEMDDFETKLSSVFSDISDVSTIEVSKEHMAWGEFMAVECSVKLLTKSVICTDIDDGEEWECETHTLDMKTGEITVDFEGENFEIVDY